MSKSTVVQPTVTVSTGQQLAIVPRTSRHVAMSARVSLSEAITVRPKPVG